MRLVLFLLFISCIANTATAELPSVLGAGSGQDYANISSPNTNSLNFFVVFEWTQPDCLDFARFGWRSPSGDLQIIEMDRIHPPSGSVDFLEIFLADSLVIDDSYETGFWHLEYLHFGKNAGPDSTLYESDMNANTVTEIVNYVDFEPPVLTNFDIGDTVVALNPDYWPYETYSPYGIGVMDDVSGVAEVVVEYTLDGASAVGSSDLSAGEIFLGTWAGTARFCIDSSDQGWVVQKVTLSDREGNAREYLQAELTSLGYSTKKVPARITVPTESDPPLLRDALFIPAFDASGGEYAVIPTDVDSVVFVGMIEWADISALSKIEFVLEHSVEGDSLVLRVPDRNLCEEMYDPWSWENSYQSEVAIMTVYREQLIPGIWNLSGCRVVDNQGNATLLDTEYFRSTGFPVNFEYAANPVAVYLARSSVEMDSGVPTLTWSINATETPEFGVEREDENGALLDLDASLVSYANGQYRFVDETADAGMRYVYTVMVKSSEGWFKLFSSGSVEIPTIKFALHPVAPNPFNPQTKISFDLPKQAVVRLCVLDVSGRLVRMLIGGEVVPEGRSEVVWNGRDDTGRRVASGTYFYRLEAGEYSGTKRMVLIK